MNTDRERMLRESAETVPGILELSARITRRAEFVIKVLLAIAAGILLHGLFHWWSS
jgi:hypothetical protein